MIASITNRSPSNLETVPPQLVYVSALGILALVFLTAAFDVSPSSDTVEASAETVSLPILVYPTDGRSQHTESVTVSGSDVSNVDSLYFRMHQPFWHVGGNNDADVPQGYDPEGAASIRVNGGTWVDVTDTTVDCAKKQTPDGCVAGAMNTIRFTIPASASGSLADGDNTISFRYNGTKGVRTGYRVLGIGFMTPGDPQVRDFDAYSGDYNGDGAKDGAIDNTTFSYRDPANFTAPTGGDATNGESLFSSRNILTNGKGESIVASCADCHFEGGEDLKYFAYSNRSIIARARFHRLTRQQGKDIAAYIRSKTLTKEDGTQYTAPGRPWNPPFQPGPEMLGSNKHPYEGNQVYWMAGAGLRWVFDSQRPNPGTERDILAHIFPKNGDPANGVAKYSGGDLKWTEIHPDSLIDVQAIPIQSQFPDWNNWLPDIHPLDADPEYSGSTVQTRYNGEFQDAFGPNKDAGDIFTAVTRIRLPSRQNLGWPNAIGTKGSGLTTNETAMGRLSTQQWRTKILVDHAFTNYAFDDAGSWNCGSGGTSWLSFCEPLALPGGTETLFRLGPHVNATFGNGDVKSYGTRKIAAEMTHLWYHLQLIMDTGAETPSSIDWNYQNAFLPDGEYPLRSIVNYVRQVQLFSNGLGNQPTEVIGRTVNWSWYNGGPKQEHLMGASKANPGWGGLSEKTTGKILEAYWRSWWSETKTYDVSTYPRDDADISPMFDDKSYGPRPGKYAPPFEKRTRYYYHFYQASEYHSDEMAGVMDSVTTWAGNMWPLGNDRSYMDQYGSQYPTWDKLVDFTPSQNIDLQPGWNFVSSRVAPSDSSVKQVFASVDGLSEVKDATGQQAYLPQPSINQIGAWSTTEGYKVHVQDAQKMTFTGEPVARDTPIELEEGWNLLPYYPSEPMNAATALAPIEDAVKVVRDEDDNEYIPSQNTNGIGDLVPGDAYAVYVMTDTTFVYPSP
jgi:hypothetical protein